MENTAEIDKQALLHFDERTRRIYAGALAKKYGYGGVSRVHRELGLDYKTIRRGLKELEEEPLTGRIREEGDGRKKEVEKQTGLGDAIEDLIDPKGDPMSILRWTRHQSKKNKERAEGTKRIQYRRTCDS